jgi:hypothetical protein
MALRFAKAETILSVNAVGMKFYLSPPSVLMFWSRMLWPNVILCSTVTGLFR